MDKPEALQLLAAELEGLRHRSYIELAHMIDSPIHTEVSGTSGARYQVEVDVHWDVLPDGDVRVVAMIDDGGLRAFVPLTRDFIKRPDGTFVDEDQVGP